MAQKELWFTCPICSRAIRVTSKTFGTDFIHESCGATLRAPDPENGRDEPEVISVPRPGLAAGMRPARIDKLAPRGMNVPRNVRKSWEAARQAKDDEAGKEEEIHELAEQIARALIEKRDGGKPDAAAGDFEDLDFEVATGAEEEDSAKAPAAEASRTPLGFGEKASGRGSELKRQFRKSTPHVGAPGAVAAGPFSEGELTAAMEAHTVKSMTPWEAQQEAPQPVEPAESGSKITRLGLLLWLLVALAGGLLLISRLGKKEAKIFGPEGSERSRAQ